MADNNKKNNSFAWLKKLTSTFRSGIKIKHKIPASIAGKTASDVVGHLSSKNYFYMHPNQIYGSFDRMLRYSDYAEMQYTPEINSALNIYAEEITSADENGNVLKVISNNSRIKGIVESLFADIINIDYNLYSWSRNLCKYGDFFLYVDIHPSHGIQSVYPIPVDQIEREEGFDVNDPLAVRFNWITNGNQQLENFQVIHFRLLGDDYFLPYGMSVLEGARRVWRQLCHGSRTKVWTEFGWKYIKDVVSGDVIYTHDFNSKKTFKAGVVDCKPMGKQEIYKIRTSRREIEVTANHGLLVKDYKGNFYYKKAIDLIYKGPGGKKYYPKRDKLVLPVVDSGKETHTIALDENLYYYGLSEDAPIPSKGIMKIIKNELDIDRSPKYIHSVLKGNRFCNVKEMKIIKNRFNIENKFIKHKINGSPYESITNENFEYVVDKDFMRFFGFMFGDGWVTPGRYRVGFALKVDEKRNTFYKSLLEELSGANPTVTESEYYRGGQVNVSSKEFSTIMRELGFDSGFENKRIPGWVFEMSRNCKIEFLRGFFDADGSKNDGRISSSNLGLLEDLQVIAHQCGVATGSGIKLDRKASKEYDESFGKAVERKDSYRLYVNLKNITDEPVTYEYVCGVDYVGEEETYDLEVDHELHNFVADGVVSHNTLLEDAVMVYRLVRCLHKDSNVWTTDGLKTIENINVGDEVYSYDYDSAKLIKTKVTDVVNNGTQEIWELKSKHRTIKANFNHPILVSNKETGEISYVNVEDIIPGTHQFFTPEITNDSEKVKVSLDSNNYEFYGHLNSKALSDFRKLKLNESKRSVERDVANELGIPFNRVHQFLYPPKNSIKGLPVECAEFICEKFGLSKENLIIYPKGFYNFDRLNLPKFVDEKFARFFGFMIGDGFLNSNKYKIGFASGVCESVNVFYKEIFESYVGKVYFERDFRNKNPILGKYTTSNIYFSNLMSDMGFKTGAHNKTIPDWIFKCSKDIKKSFILGLLDADCTDKNIKSANSYEIEMCNFNIINSLKELCHQVGWSVSSEIRKRVRNPRKILGNQCGETTSYSIYISEINQEINETILSVEKTDKFEDVWDIRVESDLHNFIADGVVVHNSPERRVFKIDVGNIPPEHVDSFIEKVRSKMKRQIVVNEKTGRVDLRYSALPIHKDSPIPLLDGRTISIENLAKEFKEGKESWVYSIQDDTHQIVPGKIKWAGKNYTTKKIIKVNLDDETFVKTAPEHPFILRDGSSIAAEDLKPGMALMPFYTQGTEIYNPANDQWDSISGISNEEVINVSFPDSDSEENFEGYKNHKVLSIEVLDEEVDVYCMTIVGPNGEDDRHNFAVCSVENAEVSASGRNEGGYDSFYARIDIGNLDLSYRKHCRNGVFIKNTVEDDYFIPVRGDRGSDISTLAGGTYTGDIQDIEYLQQKLFISLQIPKAYLGYDETGNAQNALSQIDIRFNKMIQRIQRVIESELKKMAMIHLFCFGYEGEDLLDFDIKLASASVLAIQQKQEIWRTRLELMNSLPETVSKRWAMKTIMGFDDDELEEIFNDKVEEARQDLMIQNAAAGDAAGGGGDLGGGFGGGGGFDLGGGGGAGGLDLGDLEVGGEEAGGEVGGPAGGEETGGAGGPESAVEDLFAGDQNDFRGQLGPFGSDGSVLDKDKDEKEEFARRKRQLDIKNAISLAAMGSVDGSVDNPLDPIQRTGDSGRQNAPGQGRKRDAGNSARISGPDSTGKRHVSRWTGNKSPVINRRYSNDLISDNSFKRKVRTKINNKEFERLINNLSSFANKKRRIHEDVNEGKVDSEDIVISTEENSSDNDGENN